MSVFVCQKLHHIRFWFAIIYHRPRIPFKPMHQQTKWTYQSCLLLLHPCDHLLLLYLRRHEVHHVTLHYCLVYTPEQSDQTVHSWSICPGHPSWSSEKRDTKADPQLYTVMKYWKIYKTHGFIIQSLITVNMPCTNLNTTVAHWCSKIFGCPCWWWASWRPFWFKKCFAISIVAFNINQMSQSVYKSALDNVEGLWESKRSFACLFLVQKIMSSTF